MLFDDERVVRIGIGAVSPVADTDGGGCIPEALLPLLLGRVDVGCVGPLARGSGWVMLVGSRGSSKKVGAVEAVEAVEATDAE